MHHLQPLQRFLLRYTVQFLSINSHRINDSKINFKSKAIAKRGLKSHEPCCNSEREDEFRPLSTGSKRDLGVRPRLQGADGSFLGGREAAAWRWPFTPSRTEIKKMHGCIPPFSHALSWRAREQLRFLQQCPKIHESLTIHKISFILKFCPHPTFDISCTWYYLHRDAHLTTIVTNIHITSGLLASCTL